jgi:glycosyltransferase involved in cell wall biosynthesis
MMQSGLVSIMMPAYNAASYIGQAIESVLAQHYSNWELIIVDDGSTDPTAALCARYPDPRIRRFHQPNSGEAGARNRALQEMKGEFIAFLDADDLYLPHHLEVTVSHLQQHPEHAGVYTDGHHCNANGVPTTMLSGRRRGPFQGWIFEEVVLASDVFGPPLCVMIRREVVIQERLRFDPAIVIGPDWDFFTRYAEVARFGYVNQATCLYRVHQTNITRQVDLQRRAAYLARCRQKAIQLQKFSTCSATIRGAVFYDLLINLLRGSYRQQEEISQWPEFTCLPVTEQARLLRLLAGSSIGDSKALPYVEKWLERSFAMNPYDLRGGLLYVLYKLSPALCKIVVQAKQSIQPQPTHDSPFGKLV